MTASEQDPGADETAFYQSHLDRVSRSFAVCIQQLEAPLRQWTSLAYLLCRALDTIEDSQWEAASDQARAYEAFEGFVEQPPDLPALASWAKSMPKTAKEGELLLIADAARLFALLHALPEHVRRPMQAAVLRMSAGMRHYSNQSAGTQGLRLSDGRDVNRYCYFVAGLVGHLLTRLFVLAHPTSFQAPASLDRHAFDFGLFLQKVNLLKDQRADEAEGRYLVPDREELRASLRGHMQGAVDYLTALPPQARSFRTFCGWSLFLGAASLPAIEAGQMGDSAPKLPRAQAMELMQTVAEMAQDNAALKRALAEYAHVLPDASSPKSFEGPQEKGVDDWFGRIRGDLLSHADIRALGL